MKQVQDGLFAIEEDEMPCTPNVLTIHPYVLLSTFGRGEPEEAAARILSFSQQCNQWVGVSWIRLIEMILQDYKVAQSIKEAQRYNFDQQERTKWAVRRYYKLCAFTLGVYALFVAKPTAHLREMSNVNLPSSGIFTFGPNYVVTGIYELLQKKLLRQVTLGEGESAFDVFFPTPALVSYIMQKQGVAAR